MCYDQGHIQSYIDRQLPESQMEETREHLDICEECREIYRKLMDNEILVRDSLEGLLAADRDIFRAEVAWDKLKLKTAQRAKPKEKGELKTTMKFKKLFTAAAAAAALFGLFSIGPVRTMAGDFLTIFRVEKVGVIAITPEDMIQMEKIMKEGSGLADIENFGRVEVSGKPEVKAVSLQEAAQAVDFDLKVPSVQGYGKPDLKMVSGTSVTLNLNVEKVNSVLQALGSTERLPSDLNGKEFNLVAPAGITAEYTGQAGRLMLAQSRSPYVKTSAGVDVKAVRRALLSIPALPENLKKQLEAVEDWQHTALIPVKAGQYSEVRVAGTGGVFVRGEGQGQGDTNALVWQKDGVIYVLAGDRLQQDTALNIAAGMK